MNLHELDTYKLSDAVKFHNRLNPKLWGRDEKLLPEVRSKLLEIAADFQEFLGVSDIEVKDITLSGSNAAYSYTPHSDIDLHLVVEQPQQDDEVYQELFNAKKYQYNDIHDIRIHGADVELYVQPANQPAVSLGEYSVLNDQWIEVPKRKRAKIDQTLVRHKYEDLQQRIKSALKEHDSDRIQALINKIKAMRQSGLDQHGEFGPENLAFKMLRKQGWIKRLYDHVAAAKDRELSLKEAPKKPFIYGFLTGKRAEDNTAGNEPNTDTGDYRALFKPQQPKEPAVGDLQFKTAQDYEWFKQQQAKKKELASEDAGETWDGVSPSTCMFLNEVEQDPEPMVMDFIKVVAKRLGIRELPQIKLHTDPAWSTGAHSFGRYEPDTHVLNVSLANRHILDILRTVAHELTHCKQNQDHPLPDDAGATGSRWENQANAQAGILMRDFAAAHPEYFEQKPLGESASGYIPTKKQARDPRYSMALTVDIKPGQVGKEANKMALQTDSQGRPGLLMKTVNLRESLAAEFELLEQEFLGEIKMSPSNLRAEAAKTGAIAGMEFEMIVPNVNVESEPEYEPNMDEDTRSRDFDDIRSFFYDGDYNGRRDVDNLMQALQEQFDEWGEEQIQEAWDDEGLDYLREYIETNEYWDEAEAQEEITNALQAEYGDDISGADFEKMLNAMAEEKFNEFVQDQWDNQGRYYDEARDQYFDEQRGEQSEREWLDDNYPYMSDISNSFDITWPHYTNINDNGGEMDIDNVADDFSRAIGKPINASSSYHGARREAGHYVVEPDGSLDPDDSDDGGLEFVSPPMPIDELLSDLNKVKAWAGRTGCYTNKSTGLHINISVPNYSLDKLDYVKLALLLGDRYVLDQYGRSSNSYAKSALGKVQDLVKRNPDSAKALLDKMRDGMEELATKAIHSGTTDKYTSINTKSGYIEFRSPGGDWLDENFDKIENTLLRFTVALSAAINPEAYRTEYLKKLYKLLEPTAVETKGADTIKYFSDYVAGKMPKAALRSFVKQAQLQRRIEKDPTGGQKYWWRVDKEGRNAPNTASIEIVATSREGAIAAAAMEWGNSNLPNADAYPIRPYDESPVRASVGEPQPLGQQTGRYTYRVFTTDNNRTLGTFQTDGIHGSTGAMFALRNFLRSIGIDSAQGIGYEEIGRQREPSQQPTTPQGGDAGQQGGNWGIWLTGENRFSRAPGQADNSVLRRFPSREAAEQWIEQTRATNPALRPDIEVREIEPAAQQSDSGIEYIIFNINNRSQLTGFRAANQAAAEREAESILRDLGLDPDQYDVRERHARPAQQPAAQATQQPAQNPPQPLGRGRELIGWSVRLPSGEEVTQIHGIGNNQGDANRIAAGWLRQNGYGVSGEGYEVVPLWREA